jgi:hypothetical protein
MVDSVDEDDHDRQGLVGAFLVFEHEDSAIQCMRDHRRFQR